MILIQGIIVPSSFTTPPRGMRSFAVGRELLSTVAENLAAHSYLTVTKVYTDAPLSSLGLAQYHVAFHVPETRYFISWRGCSSLLAPGLRFWSERACGGDRTMLLWCSPSISRCISHTGSRRGVPTPTAGTTRLRGLHRRPGAAHDEEGSAAPIW